MEKYNKAYLLGSGEVDGSQEKNPGGSYATFDGLGSDEIHGKPLDR